MTARRLSLTLITRHYPPAVSGGARRPYFLAAALRRLGAEVFVVAPSVPEGEPGLAVPHPNRDPVGTAATKLGLRDAAREWLLWPDPDIRWCLRAADLAASAPIRADWIWTTSPPESVHAAGLRLKRRTGARWLADFRDHWLERPHRRERLAPHRQLGEAILARRWLEQADLVTCVDSSIQRELVRLGARAPHVAPHFSPGDVASPVTLPDRYVNVVHTGSIALSDPEARIDDVLTPFFAARASNPALHLHLVGRLSEAEERQAQRDGVTLHGVQPLRVALGFQRAADALAIVGSRKMHVPPSKVVEYLTADAPIIAFGEGDWRRDPRMPRGDPVAMLAALRKSDAAPANQPAPPTADAVASQLLALMADAVA